MLILARKMNESIMIGDQIEVSIVDIKGDQVKIGIKAPKTVKIYRQEVYKAIQMENIRAVKIQPDVLPTLDNLFKKKEKPDKSDT
jgi:carbon storage regulator